MRFFLIQTDKNANIKKSTILVYYVFLLSVVIPILNFHTLIRDVEVEMIRIQPQADRSSLMELLITRLTLLLMLSHVGFLLWGRTKSSLLWLTVCMLLLMIRNFRNSPFASYRPYSCRSAMRDHCFNYAWVCLSWHNPASRFRPTFPHHLALGE